MIYRVMADIIVVIHFLFICFVVAGGFLALKWRRVVWAHIPAAVWAAFIEFSGWICPLTPLENKFRYMGGSLGYSGGFIEHYLIPLIYPSGLTREIQFIIGDFVVVLNITLYWFIVRKWRSA